MVLHFSTQMFVTKVICMWLNVSFEEGCFVCLCVYLFLLEENLILVGLVPII